MERIRKYLRIKRKKETMRLKQSKEEEIKYKKRKKKKIRELIEKERKKIFMNKQK